MDHLEHLARRLVHDLEGHGQGGPNAGSTAPAVLDSSLRTVVPHLVTWLLAGIRRRIAVLDDIEVNSKGTVRMLLAGASGAA